MPADLIDRVLCLKASLSVRAEMATYRVLSCIFLTWRPSYVSHHQSDADQFEGPEHVLRHRDGRGYSISAFREAYYDDVVIANAIQGVSVTAVRRDARQRRVFVVEELASGDEIRLHRADPSHGVDLTVHGFSSVEDDRPFCCICNGT